MKAFTFWKYKSTTQKGVDKINLGAIKSSYLINTKGVIRLCLILVCLSLTACVVTHDTRTTMIEIMKPGVINIPEHAKTVALVNSVSNNLGYQPFKYSDHLLYYNETESDTTIKYRALSNLCLDALASELKKVGYFAKVINLHDSLTRISPSNKELLNPEKLFQETQTDLCIFLDHFNFEIEKFTDFDIAVNAPSLSWIIVTNKDTLSYTIKQKDTLTYTVNDFPPNLPNNMKIKMVVNNSARFLGQTFCSKIIPTWVPVDRIYYTSNNRDMRQSEKLLLNNDWLKAAEIWNKQTKSKNKKIAVKSSFNMALASEMEGKYDVAIGWLIHSSSIMKQNNEGHILNCQNYIGILNLRKKEIEKLSQQVRH